MGRHGGGSSSGGSRGRSGGSSRSGSGSSVRTSKEPFNGCYHRRWYSRGRYHTIYTSDKDFGTRKGWSLKNLFIIFFVFCHMCLMLSGVGSSMIQIGSKINGDPNFITVEDTINLLSDEEEQRVEKLFKRIYDKSGMPIILYTDTFDYKASRSIESYSEELYYNRTLSEDSMIILFTVDIYGPEPFDWDYDMYCGDDTVKCFSDNEFDKVLENFQKAMYRGNLADALEYSWDLVIDDLAETEISWTGLPIILFISLFYLIFFIPIISSIKKNNAAYKYFKAHPEELSMTPYEEKEINTTSTSENEPYKCNTCGAINAIGDETCRYCGAVLIQD